MELIKKANWPLIVFVLLGVVSAVNPSFSLAASALVLGLYVGFAKYLTEQRNKVATDEQQGQLKTQLEDVNRKVADMSNFVSGMTLKQTIASTENRRFF